MLPLIANKNISPDRDHIRVLLLFLFYLLSPCLSGKCIVKYDGYHNISVCTESSRNVSYISDITSCEGDPVTITFNITGLEYCEPNYYLVHVYHQESQKYLDTQNVDYLLYSDINICNISLTIEEVLLSHNDSLNQVRIRLLNNGAILYCSNNFTLLIQGQWYDILIDTIIYLLLFI